MTVIFNWRAARSGASMTIRGFTREPGKDAIPFKVSRILLVEPRTIQGVAKIVAVAVDGTEYRLAVHTLA